jgi:hypothetical protein
MADAHAGMALQSLLSGEDALARGEAKWAEAKRLEAAASVHQSAALARGRRPKELERDKLHLAEFAAKTSAERERAIAHLRMGQDWLRDGAMVLWRGSRLQPQTPLMQATAAVWLASDPYIAVPGDSAAAHEAARVQFEEAAQWLVAPGPTESGVAERVGANPNDPWARTWLSLAKARILASRPATAAQVQPALQAAVAHEPHFVRGRWEIAAAAEQAGQRAAAQHAADAVLQQAPGHEKALALIERLKAAPAPLSGPKAVRGHPRRAGRHAR